MFVGRLHMRIVALIGTQLLAAPAHALEPIQFMNFSDMHLSLLGKNTMKMGADSETIVKTCVQLANQTPGLDFVILTGDLLQDGEPYNLDMIRHYLDQLKMPYYAVLGNHDMSPVHAHDAKGPIFPGISKSVFTWAFQGHGFQGPDYHWSQTVAPGLKLVGLDTTVPGTWGGTVPAKTLAWLERELAASKGQLVIPIAHHNLIEFTPDDHQHTRNFLVDNAPQVRAVLEKYRPTVQVAISGHHHLSGRRDHQGITYLTNPSTTTWPMEYTTYQLRSDKLTYQVKALPLPPAMVDEARRNLLAESWWHPRGAPTTEPAKTEAILSQYRGQPSDRSGTIGLQPR
jgi:Icc protein